MKSRPFTAFALLSVPTMAVLILAASSMGCGDSSGKTSATSEPEGRYKGLRSLSESNTKQVIAENKKKALAELKEKRASSSASAKP